MGCGARWPLRALARGGSSAGAALPELWERRAWAMRGLGVTDLTARGGDLAWAADGAPPCKRTCGSLGVWPQPTPTGTATENTVHGTVALAGRAGCFVGFTSSDTPRYGVVTSAVAHTTSDTP